jgi:hypothetical protein
LASRGEANKRQHQRWSGTAGLEDLGNGCRGWATEGVARKEKCHGNEHRKCEWKCKQRGKRRVNRNGAGEGAQGFSPEASADVGWGGGGDSGRNLHHHSAIGYVSPAEFERAVPAKEAA